MIHSFWTGVFWPYFQFAIFVVAIIYFAKKPIQSFLDSKRDDFRTKLSEAHESLILAERKIKQYEEQLASLTQHIENIEKQYKENTELEQKRILDEANANAESVLNDAKRAAHELIAQTQQGLKSEMFEIVLKEFEKQLSPERLSDIENQFRQNLIHSIPQALNSRDTNPKSDSIQ